ncbi:MAG: hypothetical protein Kow00121_14780 [Elainellaceae cyanobacterium]
MSHQLELPLWDSLRAAQTMPEQANLSELLSQMEGALSQMSDQEQLHWVGEAMLRVAELCELRAQTLLMQWEEAYRDPIVESGFFEDLVRQTMAVDLSELMEPDPPRKPRTKSMKSSEKAEGSIAAPVDKAAVLAIVAQWEQEAALQQQQVLAIAHDENVSKWIEAIAQWLQTTPTGQACFVQLCQQLKMPRVEVWLGLLLGGFELRQEGEFYSQNLWVKRASDS